MTIISFYNAPVTNTIPNKNIGLFDVFNIIKSDKYKLLCREAKNLKANGQEEELRKFKAKNFDYVTFPGTFQTREEKSWLNHSGFFCADVDSIKNIDVIREKLIKDKYVLACWNSATDGLRVLINIPTDKDKYSDYVESFYKYLADNFGIIGKVDSKVKNPSQPCFLSYDPNLFYNPMAEKWDKIIEKVELIEKNNNYPTLSEATLKDMLKHIPCRGWGEHTFHIMLSLIHYGKYRNKNYFGLFRWWIENFKGGITVEDLQKKWEKYTKEDYPKPVTIRSLIKESLEHGYEVKDTQKQDNAIINSHDELYLNAAKIVNDEKIAEDESGILYKFYQDKGYKIINEDKLIDILANTIPIYYVLESKTRNKYIIAMRIASRERFQDLKKLSLPSAIFTDNGYLFKTKEQIKINSDYFYLNTISTEGFECSFPKIRKFLESYGDFDKLAEIIAYLCIDGNPLKLIFTFHGPQDTGKSTLQEFIINFLGENNVSTGNLKLLSDSNQRFEIAQTLRGKLVVFCNELDGKNVYDTAMLKNLSGNDELRAEYKGVNGIQKFRFGGKVIILCNDIPQLNDISDSAFMSRVVIIDFNKKFERETLTPLDFFNDEEYKGFSFYIQNIIKKWMNDGKIIIKGVGNLDERIKNYAEKSNPLNVFLNENCEFGDGFIPCWELRQMFQNWQKDKGFTVWDEKRICHALNNIENIKRTQKYPEGKAVWVYTGIKYINIQNMTKSKPGQTEKPLFSLRVEQDSIQSRNASFSVCSSLLLPEYSKKIVEILSQHQSVIDSKTMYKEFKDNGMEDEEHIEECLETLKNQGEIIELPKGYYQILK